MVSLKGKKKKDVSAVKDESKKLDQSLITKAVESLLKFHNTESSTSRNVLEVSGAVDSNVSLQFGLAKIVNSQSGRGKPIAIKLKHPMYKVAGADDQDKEENDDMLESMDICLITKHDSKPMVQDLVDRFPSHLSCIKKVLTLESLRKKYPEYKHRRMLKERYDLFVVDERILPMVGKALGREFFAKTTPPIPINVMRKEAFPFAIQNILKQTYMVIPAGTCLGIKIGTTAMTSQKLVDNVIQASNEVANKLPGGWHNIISISVKLTKSMALPFYNSSYEELRELARLSNPSDPKLLGVPLQSDDDRRLLKDVAENAAVSDTETGSPSPNKKRTATEANDKLSKMKKKSKKEAPLVAALKKQKELEAAAAKQNDDDIDDDDVAEQLNDKEERTSKNEKSNEKKKKKKRSMSIDEEEEEEDAEMKKKKKNDLDDDDEKVGEAKESSAKKEKKHKKKKKRSMGMENVEEQDNDEEDTKKTKNDALAAAASTPAAKKKVKEDNDSKTKNTKQVDKEKDSADDDDKAVTKSSSTKSPSSATPKALFMASKKFKGSKEGYVFRAGTKGVGYYKDDPPKVDLEALMKSIKKGRGGGRAAPNSSSKADRHKKKQKKHKRHSF